MTKEQMKEYYKSYIGKEYGIIFNGLQYNCKVLAATNYLQILLYSRMAYIKGFTSSHIKNEGVTYNDLICGVVKFCDTFDTDQLNDFSFGYQRELTDEQIIRAASKEDPLDWLFYPETGEPREKYAKLFVENEICTDNNLPTLAEIKEYLTSKQCAFLDRYLKSFINGTKFNYCKYSKRDYLKRIRLRLINKGVMDNDND